MSNKEDISKMNEYKRILNRKGTYQLQLAKDLCKFADVTITRTGRGIVEFKKFRRYLLHEKRIIKVYEIKDSNSLDIIFNGENMLPENNESNYYKKILYFQSDNHFDVITNFLSCVNRRKYCEFCNIGFTRNYNHICKNKCKLCYNSPACNLENDKIKCGDCLRYFLGEGCLQHHKSENSFGINKSICNIADS